MRNATSYFCWSVFNYDSDQWVHYSISVRNRTVVYTRMAELSTELDVDERVMGLAKGREHYKSMVAEFGQPQRAYTRLEDRQPVSACW